MTDKDYMTMAIELARKGTGNTNPNPLVGAVIVKNNRIIGHGFHEKYGQLHAERNAIASLTESAEGSTIYVTLEPCCHYGKTPPCTEAIIENKISKVVIGSRDPNPKVAGKGAMILREHGIEVIEDFMRDECDKLNGIFFHYITTNTPYAIMKYAMTMDGKIATSIGESKWITGEIARENVHKTRHQCAGIMVGIGTVLADDPMLTCRIPNGNNPIRIIADTTLRTPLTSKVVNTTDIARTIIATTISDGERLQAYTEKGVEILEVSLKNDHLDLNDLMDKLGKKNIDSVLLEGGSTLNYSALEQGIVQKVQCYIAPKIFGGTTSKSPVGGSGVKFPSECFVLKEESMVKLGDDYLIESEVLPCSQE